MTDKQVFTKETELCADFVALVKAPWIVYAETEGWDILLINSIDCRQIGIQAKLKLNPKVLAQAVENEWQERTGPDYRAVLVPYGQANDLTKLAPFCGITIIYMSNRTSWGNPHFYPQLPGQSFYGAELNSEWHERLPIKRHSVPEFIPDVRAGSPSPIQLTRWKIAALKLAVRLDRTGYLTRADFKELQIDIRRWIGADNWLKPDFHGFIAGPNWPNWCHQHPIVYAEIESDPSKWERVNQKLI